jgi:hypothetical protein
VGGVLTDEEMWFRLFETIAATKTYPDGLTIAHSATQCLEEFRRKFSHPTPDAEPTPEEANETRRWYVRARAYGAIASKFREALTLIQMTGGRDATNVAKAALDWRTENGGGVSVEALEEFDVIMNTEVRRELTSEELQRCLHIYANGGEFAIDAMRTAIGLADEIRRVGVK